MMDEMAKTLARRRAAVEKKQPEQPLVWLFQSEGCIIFDDGNFFQEPESSPDKKSVDKNNTSSNNKFSNGAESPKSSNKKFASTSDDTLLKINGVNDGFPFTSQDVEAFKAEIIKEVRKEFQKMKTEILEGEVLFFLLFILLFFNRIDYFRNLSSAKNQQNKISPFCTV